jgi:hypothetical protein
MKEKQLILTQFDSNLGFVNSLHSGDIIWFPFAVVKKILSFKKKKVAFTITEKKIACIKECSVMIIFGSK